MIVVDTNVLAYLYLPGEHTAAAENWIREEPEWAAPTLWRSEFRNVLSGYVRRKTLTRDQAQRLRHRSEALMNDHDYQVLSSEVLKLVHNSNCSAYDCGFIALAQHLETKLVTIDGKLLRPFPEIAAMMNGR